MIEEANLLLLLLSEAPSSPVDSCSSQDALHQTFHAIFCQEEIVPSFMPPHLLILLLLFLSLQEEQQQVQDEK
jgi:hypothetical protein